MLFRALSEISGMAARVREIEGTRWYRKLVRLRLFARALFYSSRVVTDKTVWLGRIPVDFAGTRLIERNLVFRYSESRIWNRFISVATFLHLCAQ